MYAASQAFHDAVKNGNHQIPLLVFSNRYFTDKDIDVDRGIEFDDNFNMEEDIAIGQATSNEIRFALFNDDQSLNEFEFGEFKAYLGVQIESTVTSEADGLSFNDVTRMCTVRKNGMQYTYEMVPLGVFIAERPNVPDQIRIELTCYDRMTKFDEDMPSGLVNYPCTIGQLFTALCQHMNVPYKTSTFINSTATIPKEPEAFESATMRQVLMWIAEAAGSNARFDRDGYLVMDWLRQTTQNYDEHDYTEFMPYWYETQQVGMVYNRTTDSGIDTTYGSGVEYLIQDNPLLAGLNEGATTAMLRQKKQESMEKEQRKMNLCLKADGTINYDKLLYLSNNEENWEAEAEEWDRLHPGT